MFKFIIDSLDQVAEGHRQFYVKNEETGKYQLQVEGAVPRAKVDEFRNNNITLTNEVAGLKTQLASFKGIDPAKWNEYKTKAEAFKGDQDIDEIVTQRLEAATAQHRETVQKLTNDLNSTTADYHNTLIGNEVRTAAMKAGARADALEDIVRRATGTFSVVNGKAVIQKEGQVVYGSDGVSPMSSFEWAKNLAKDAPYFFNENQGGGGQPGSFKTDLPREKMTAQQMISAGLNNQN
ncbi:MAG: hypothetical protein RSE18_00070 [Acinetobacter sp.]